MKVGRLSELNDPFDCRFRVKFQNENERISAKKVEDGIYEVRQNQYGIISFSKECSNPALWAHYADSHKGIALVFQFPNEKEDLIRVKYSERIPMIDLCDIKSSSNEKENADIMGSSVSQKSTTWRYEKEYRFLVPFGRCQLLGSHYFVNFDETIFVGVVIGIKSNITPVQIRQIYSESGIKNGKIWRATSEGDSYKIKKEKV